MASQSVPIGELKHDLNVEPEHGGLCNGNVTDMEVVVEAETKLNGETNGQPDGEREANGAMNEGDQYDGEHADDANKKNEGPVGSNNDTNTKSNGEVTISQQEPQTKKQTKTKRRSSSSASSKHKRPKQKTSTVATKTTLSSVATSSSSASLLFGLVSYKNLQLRDPIVAFDTSLETSKNWITWLRLELIEVIFDSTWRPADGTGEDDTDSTISYSLAQVVGEFVLIGYLLADYVFRFSVVLIVSVVKLYLHLIRGIVGLGLRKVGIGK